MAITDDEIEDFIQHFGKKGMHWGIRNKIRSVGRKTGSFIRGHPKTTAAAAASAAIGASFIAKKLLSKRSVKSLPPVAKPGDSLFKPQNQALIDELKNWKVVDSGPHSRELAKELTNWKMH